MTDGPATTSPQQRMLALRQRYDHYVHTAYAASEWLSVLPLVTLPESTSGPVMRFPDASSAQAWFRREYIKIAELIWLGDGPQFSAHIWRLAYLLAHPQHQNGNWSVCLDFADHGIVAAGYAGDRLGLAYCHRSRGIAAGQLGQHERAQTDLYRAATTFGAAGLHAHEAQTLSDLSDLLLASGRSQEADVIADRARMRYGGPRTLLTALPTAA